MTQVREVMKKMCVVGEAAAGKTSLIRKYVVDKFDDKYIVTIGTKTSKKILTVKGNDDEVSLKLMIWDVLGQDQFAKLKKSAFKGSNGAFIVLDLTRRETLEAFGKWLSSLYSVVPGIPIVVMANKNDLKGEFGAKEIEEVIKEYGFPHFLTSAKTGENVDDAFYTLGKMMIDKWKYEVEKTESEILKQGESIEPVNEIERNLSPIDVEDIIMARFCNLLEDPEYAMAIIREQFKRVGVDFRNPTPQGLEKVVDAIINAASDQVEAVRLRKERSDYSNLIRRIEGQERKDDLI